MQLYSQMSSDCGCIFGDMAPSRGGSSEVLHDCCLPLEERLIKQLLTLNNLQLWVNSSGDGEPFTCDILQIFFLNKHTNANDPKEEGKS